MRKANSQSASYRSTIMLWRCMTFLILLSLVVVSAVSARLHAAETDRGSKPIPVFEVGKKYGYRIPALTVSKKGTLLAFCERRVGLHDHAQNDMVLRRSTDGGKTWQPLQVLVDEGGDSLNDPCAVVLDSGRILLRYKRYPKGIHARRSSHTEIAEPGYGGPKNVRVFFLHSDDDGKTWTKPREVTRQVRRESAVAVGSPGVAIQLSRGKNVGRIVYPNYEVYHTGMGRRRWCNSVSYSDDGGKTWQLSGSIDGGSSSGNGNEAQVVELADGSILLSARNQGGKDPARRIAQSTDGGETWSTETLAKDLMTPACMSSVIRYRWPDGKKLGVLLHSLPNTKKSRSNGTIFASHDEGKSWQKLRVVEPKGFAYSCLAKLPNGDVGCLYETDGYKSIVFARYPFAWLTTVVDGKDTERAAQKVSKASTRPTAASKLPNILFIVSEDNSEQIGCYGDKRVHTPALDSLAKTGIRYTNAYVPYSVCSPSRAAFLTGLYPRQTGHIGLATHKFAMYKSFKTIPAYFQEAGYYTGFLGKTHVNPASAVEDFVDRRGIPQSNFRKTIGITEYAKHAKLTIDSAAKADKPFCLIINYADAHRSFVGVTKHNFPTVRVENAIKPMPWIGSDTPEFRNEMRNYLNCMNRLDEGIGMVLKVLDKTGVRDNTLIVYISDHGADFPRAKGSVYEGGTRIPMIVNYPRVFSTGKVEGSLVSTLDILPTMLKATGQKLPAELVGRPLQDLDSGKIQGRKFIHTFTTGSSPNLLYMQLAIRDERYKLIYNPSRDLNLLAQSRYTNSNLPNDQFVKSFLHPSEYELYDLKSDPYEWNNLADNPTHKETKAGLLKAMKDFQKEIKDPFVDKSNIDRFIAEQKKHLDRKTYRHKGFRWPHLEMFERKR